MSHWVERGRLTDVLSFCCIPLGWERVGVGRVARGHTWRIFLDVALQVGVDSWLGVRSWREGGEEEEGKGRGGVLSFGGVGGGKVMVLGERERLLGGGTGLGRMNGWVGSSILWLLYRVGSLSMVERNWMSGPGTGEVQFMTDLEVP